MTNQFERPILETHNTRCLHRNTMFGAVRFANGTRHAVRHCPECGCNSNYYSLKELAQRGVKIESLDIVRDNLDSRPCEVCRSRDGVEVAHWAPEEFASYFRNWVAWPTALLCRPCHEEWHRVVTPDIVAQTITMYELGATRRTTLRELVEKVRARLAGREAA